MLFTKIMYAKTLHGLIIVEMLDHGFKYVDSMGKMMLFKHDEERNGYYVEIRGLGIIGRAKAVFGLNSLEARIGTYSINDDYESEPWDFGQPAIYICPEEGLLKLRGLGPVTCAIKIREGVISMIDGKIKSS